MLNKTESEALVKIEKMKKKSDKELKNKEKQQCKTCEVASF